MIITAYEINKWTHTLDIKPTILSSIGQKTLSAVTSLQNVSIKEFLLLLELQYKKLYSLN